MEFLLLTFALLLCAAVLSLRASKTLEAEGENANPECVDRVVLGSTREEPVGYAAAVCDSFGDRRLSAARASSDGWRSEGTALVSTRNAGAAWPAVIARERTPEIKCTAVRKRVTYYRMDGSVGSTHETEVLQYLQGRA